MATVQQPGVELLALLPSPAYVLSYSLPLLLLSIVLTFAGAFLTLDRSRSFAPRYDALPGGFDPRGKKKFHWLLEGGVGGLASGYVFGVHLSTFLALLIPTKSPSAPLSPKSFIPVWLLSTAVTTFLAGRWKHAALAFSGISGGATLSLSLSIILHPSLLTRIVLIAIFTPIVTVMTLLPIAYTQHAALRLATGSTGAFGVVVSIALLARIPAWANVWERLWLSYSLAWGTPQERGLSAAWCLFLCAGTGCDWFLRRRFGENPDEVWDHYLANYASNLPNAADRAGTFQPFSNSFWGRIFGRKKPAVPLADTMTFPPDDDTKPRSSSHTPGLQSSVKDATLHKVSELLKDGEPRSQARLKARAGRKEGAKFRPLTDLDESSSSDSDDDTKVPMTPDSVRPWLKVRTSFKSVTSESAIVNGNEGGEMGKLDPEAEGIKLGRIKAGLGKTGRVAENDGEVPDYSDYEEDVTAHASRAQRRVSRGTPGWSPEFLDRHRPGNTASGSGSGSEATSRRTTLPEAVPVPATPSLIKAMDRIAVAQKQAFAKLESREGLAGLPPVTLPRERQEGSTKAAKDVPPTKKARGARWEEFWREVREKAG